MARGLDEDPHEGTEGGLTDKEQIFVIVTVVLVVITAFEKIKDFFTEVVAHSGMSEIVEHLFGELTIMGFIGLIIFLLDKLNALNEDLNEKAEQMHMIIFVVALIFLAEVIMLIKLGVNMESKWRLQEECIQADVVQGRIAVMYEFVEARAAYNRSFWSRLNPAKRNRYLAAKSTLEFHGIRDAFIEDKVKGIMHGSNETDWERIRNKVDHNFVLSEYLKYLMHETIGSLVEITGLTWFSIWAAFVPLWLILEFSNANVALLCFIVLPYLTTLVLHKVVHGLSNIRASLVPTLMPVVCDDVAGMVDVENLPDADDGGCRRVSLSPKRGSIMPPRMGSAIVPHASDAHEPTARTPLLTPAPRRMGSDFPMAPSNGNADEAAAPALHVTFADLPLRSLSEGSERNVHTPVPATPVIIDITDHLTVTIPGHVYRVLEGFVVQHHHHFAPVDKMPYTQPMLSLPRRNRASSVGGGESGRRRRRHSYVMQQSRAVADLSWLEQIVFGYWDERHNETARVTPHEELFAFKRRGPMVVLAFAQVQLLYTAVFLSVLFTTLLPGVIWNNDSFHASVAVKAAVTVVACLPPMLLYGQVYRLIELYVVVAHTGMMRVPRVVMKVLRDHRTRKSLGILKLLSVVSGHAPGAASPEAGMLSPDDLGDLEEASGSINSGGEGGLREPAAMRVSRSSERGSDAHARRHGSISLKRRRRRAERTAANAFEVCDKDKSGRVTYEEFKTLLESLGMHKSDQELADICEVLDEDASGEIDRREFFEWFVNLQLNNQPCDLSTDENVEGFVNLIFRVIDKDGSNHISTEELLDTLKMLGQNDLSYEDVREIVADVDRDGSGGIDREEFIAYVKKHAEFI